MLDQLLTSTSPTSNAVSGRFLSSGDGSHKSNTATFQTVSQNTSSYTVRLEAGVIRSDDSDVVFEEIGTFSNSASNRLAVFSISMNALYRATLLIGNNVRVLMQG